MVGVDDLTVQNQVEHRLCNMLRKTELGVGIRCFGTTKIYLSPFRKQQWFVVASAVENVHHLDGVGTNAVENQVIAERTSADAEMFVARH
jgi:hypothetical protein